MVKMTLGNAPVYPPLPALSDTVETWVGKVDYITSVNILLGFDHEYRGTTYHFNYQLDDQTNFAQMNTSAGISITMETMPEEVLKQMFGATKDGKPDYANFPVLPASRWQCEWQGHTDKPNTLEMTVNEYLALAASAGKHNELTLAEGRTMKSQLRAVADEAELNRLVKSLDLDNKYRIAREKYDAMEAKRLMKK